MAKPNKKQGAAGHAAHKAPGPPRPPPRNFPKENKDMPENKPSSESKENSSARPEPGSASGQDKGKGTAATPVTEKPVPQKRELSRYVVSVDKAGGTLVKLEKLDDQTGKTQELSRDEYAAAFASAAYPSPAAMINAGYASPLLARQMMGPLTTERKQAMDMNSLSFTQGAADAAAALAAYGLGPDQFGGFADSYGGYADAAGGYSDAFGGYSDATGGYYDAAGGYSDAYGGYSDVAGGYTDAYGGYSDTAGGYSDAYGGYTDATGGYSDPYGGYSDAAGGYTDALGGYTDPAGGYTDAAGNYTDPASAAYIAGAMSQMPY
jgi:hypothetical protein